LRGVAAVRGTCCDDYGKCIKDGRKGGGGDGGRKGAWEGVKEESVATWRKANPIP
jgi:hypothetical protein